MQKNCGFVNIPIVIGLIFIIAVGGYFAFGPKLNMERNPISNTLSQTESSGWQTYRNEEGGYSFKYPNEWNVAINKFNSKNALFGPGATDESGIGGVEYEGELSSGQSLSGFVKKFNEGVESGSISETETIINGNDAVISILPKASLVDSMETKSVSFEKGDEVFNAYLTYKTNFDKYPEDKQNLTAFDQILSTFKFISS